MVASTTENGSKAEEMDGACSYGKMGVGMKVNGKKTEAMARARSITHRATGIPEVGVTERLMGSAFLHQSAEQSMKASGRRTSSRVMDRRSGQMVLPTEGTTGTARKTGTVYFRSLTEGATQASFLTGRSMGKEPTSGLTEGNIMASGSRIKWMEEGACSGRMEENISVNTRMIKKMDWDCSPGRMEEFIKDSGLMGSSMVLGYTQTKEVKNCLFVDLNRYYKIW